MSFLRRGIAALAVGFFACGFTTNPPSSVDVPVIVTAAPAYDALAALRGGERFPQGAHLLRVDHGAAKPLLTGFAASGDAAVSFDAAHVLFAGKKSAGDRWSIWELALGDGSVRKVMDGATDLIRPLYLPEGWLTYARRTGAGYQMEVARLDGSGVRRITFLRSSALPADVLADGRILLEAGFPLGVGLERGAQPEMYLVYPDGSGVESYRCDHGGPRWGGRQVSSGDVIFTHGAALARFTSARATEERVAAPPAEYAGGVAETAAGDWLLSERAGKGGRYALALWSPSSRVLRPFLSRGGEHLIDPVLIAARPAPRVHPIGLHKWDYANLLALDARLSREGDLKTLPAKVEVQTVDAQGHAVTLGTAPVASDGSFFVQAPGNQPIRFALLDGKGAVVRAERGWFWIAKGEQRICVGCHTGPERAPENRVPAVLLRTTAPVHLTGASSPAVPGGR